MKGARSRRTRAGSGDIRGVACDYSWRRRRCSSGMRRTAAEESADSCAASDSPGQGIQVIAGTNRAEQRKRGGVGRIIDDKWPGSPKVASEDA